jgi:hypothetical protein
MDKDDGHQQRGRPCTAPTRKPRPARGQATRHAIVQRTLKQNDVKLVVYVPANIAR